MASQARNERTTHLSTERIPNGLAAAAILSSAIGVFVIGFLTTLSEASHGVGSVLNWYNPAGSLNEKTGVGIIIWLISWAVLRGQWKDRDIDLGPILTWTAVLLVLGFLLTFPPFFEIFKQ